MLAIRDRAVIASNRGFALPLIVISSVSPSIGVVATSVGEISAFSLLASKRAFILARSAGRAMVFAVS